MMPPLDRKVGGSAGGGVAPMKHDANCLVVNPTASDALN